MKKIKLIILAGAALLTFNACNKLELAPEDYFGSGSFWKTKAQVDGAMIGLHSQLRGAQFTFYNLGELRGGSLKDGTGGTGTSSLNSASVIRQLLTEASPGISGWGGLYGNIFQVNNFIYQVEQASFLSPAEKGYNLGQAYGVRAFYYFHLYRTFGRVPIVKDPKVINTPPSTVQDAYNPRAATEKEVLDFIKDDISKSETGFNSDFTTKATKSQWSLGATLMLKTEVYLWTAKVNTDGAAPANMAADLATARTAVEAVIPRFAMLSSFNNVFRYNNKGNSEIIFALRYMAGEATNNFSQFIYQASDPMGSFVNATGGSLVPNSFQPDATKTGDPMNVAGGGAIIRYEYKYDLFAQYEADDTRAKVTFFDYYKAPITPATSFVMLGKYIGTIVEGARNFSDDVPVYRSAEAYLLLAEIKNKQGENPEAEIEAVRQRAYGASPFPDFVNGTFEENELAIFLERSKELVAESKRWYDLRRMQSANGDPLAYRIDLPMVGVIDKTTDAHKLLWPIDRGTLTSDETLMGDQNPGY
ncbi:MAG TPA: RagB/SusD family nutrient uptake outer membrane protein [Chitinophagaceae bacterium]|nr:RagB/SusD family nutrient uptake outer membrane protein [Chitinophagaceae bacterium]